MKLEPCSRTMLRACTSSIFSATGSVMLDFLGSAAGLTFSILLVAATALLYFFKHLTESFERRRRASARAERVTGALYAEIQANIEGLRDFLDNAAAARPTEAQRGGKRGHETLPGPAHTLVYESHLGDLECIPNAVVVKVVAFYSQLERFSGLVEMYERTRLGDAAPEQRSGLLADLVRNAERAEKLGREALHALEVHVPLRLMPSAMAAAA